MMSSDHEDHWASCFTSDDEYDRCKARIERRLSQLEELHNQAGEWLQWGTEDDFERGNPIIARYKYDRSKGFRIRAYPSEPDNVDLDAYLETYPESEPNVPAVELAIGMKLRPASIDRCFELLDEWLRPTTTVEAMRTMIEKG